MDIVNFASDNLQRIKDFAKRVQDYFQNVVRPEMKQAPKQRVVKDETVKTRDWQGSFFNEVLSNGELELRILGLREDYDKTPFSSGDLVNTLNLEVIDGKRITMADIWDKDFQDKYLDRLNLNALYYSMESEADKQVTQPIILEQLANKFQMSVETLSDKVIANREVVIEDGQIFFKVNGVKMPFLSKEQAKNLIRETLESRGIDELSSNAFPHCDKDFVSQLFLKSNYDKWQESGVENTDGFLNNGYKGHGSLTMNRFLWSDVESIMQDLSRLSGTEFCNKLEQTVNQILGFYHTMQPTQHSMIVYRKTSASFFKEFLTT